MSEVVLADADRRGRERATAALRFGGYRVRVARSVSHAAELLGRPGLAALIVDPTAEEPATVVAELRARTLLPIIVVSARSAEWDKVTVLDAGADDYLTKPVGADELVARLRAVLRRVAPHDGDEPPIATPDFTLHLSDRQALSADGADVHLTPVEWRIVDVLAERAGHLVPHEDLLRRVWGPKALEKPGNVRVNMAHIRAKLEPEPSEPRYFITAPGLGVRFDPAGGAA